jgi:hypothetical protein
VQHFDTHCTLLYQKPSYPCSISVVDYLDFRPYIRHSIEKPSGHAAKKKKTPPTPTVGHFNPVTDPRSGLDARVPTAPLAVSEPASHDLDLSGPRPEPNPTRLLFLVRGDGVKHGARVPSPPTDPRPVGDDDDGVPLVVS